MALSNIVSQSNKPLKISITFGFFMSLSSLMYAVYLIIGYMLWGVPVAGWTSVIVSVYFVGGLLFANLGIVGLYIGKVFDETKARPLYVVRERTWSESMPFTADTANADVRPINPDALSRDKQGYRSR